MFKTIDAKTELVFTKGEYGYKEVLDNFKTAKYVKVTTYSITIKESDDIILRLRDLEENIDVEIITNEFIYNKFDEKK